jgi:signal transduction histidine kinase
MLDELESLVDGVRRISDNIAHDLRTPLARLRNRLESGDPAAFQGL